MKFADKKMIRTKVSMNTATKVIKSKKDKLRSRQALKKSLKDLY